MPAGWRAAGGWLRLAVAGCCIATLAGCASYVTPGAKADLQVFAPASVQAGFAAKATAPFPAAIALVRVQAPAYSNYGLRQSGGSYGTGRYSVVTTREVEDEALVARMSSLDQVAGVTGVNRMLLPPRLEGEADIRDAAARLHADLIFLYTFDTSFFDTDLAKPLTVVSLGLFPSRKVFVTTTASALLIDTRTGFVYSTYESTRKAETLSSTWSSGQAADTARLQNEREAFAQLVGEFAQSWPALLRRHRSAGG